MSVHTLPIWDIATFGLNDDHIAALEDLLTDPADDADLDRAINILGSEQLGYIPSGDIDRDQNIATYRLMLRTQVYALRDAGKLTGRAVDDSLPLCSDERWEDTRSFLTEVFGASAGGVGDPLSFRDFDDDDDADNAAGEYESDDA